MKIKYYKVYIADAEMNTEIKIILTSEQTKVADILIKQIVDLHQDLTKYHVILSLSTCIWRSV